MQYLYIYPQPADSELFKDHGPAYPVGAYEFSYSWVGGQPKWEIRARRWGDWGRGFKSVITPCRGTSK